MARFLVMTEPYLGHVTPTRPIVRKLVERDHEVVWISGRQFKDKIETTGARFHPLPKASDPDGMEVYEFYPELGALKGLAQIKWWIKHVFMDGCDREIYTIESVVLEFQPDVVIGDTCTASIYLWSEMKGVSSAMISLLPLCLVSCDTAPYGIGLPPGMNPISRVRNRLLNTFVYRTLMRDVTAYMNATRRRHGLKRMDRLPFRYIFEKRSLVLHISTPAFEYPRRDLPEHIQFIGPILQRPNTNFQRPPWWTDLNGSQPVILVNQGTIATVLDDLIVPTIKGLKGESMLVVAVPVKEGQLGTLPTNVRAEPFIPFDRLLPYVDLMVTNGGYGGTQIALAYGIPLVVAGETEDKKEVAARVEWSGAGINLRKRRPSPKAVREAIIEVLNNPVYRNNAQRIQANFAQYNAPLRAAKLLETLARNRS